jgi:hypothetical protein
MEVAGSSEMPVPTNQTTCFYNRKDTIQIFIAMKNMKSHSLTHFLPELSHENFKPHSFTHSVTQSLTHFLLCVSQESMQFTHENLKPHSFTHSLTHSLSHILLGVSQQPMHFIHENLKPHSLIHSLPSRREPAINALYP